MAKGSCHLYLGPEIGERQDAVAALRQGLAAKTGVPPEEHSFYAGEDPVSAMVSLLRNGSLFADTRLVLIKNAELIKKKEEAELLAAYLAAPQEGTTLVLISDATAVDKHLEAAVPKEAKRVFWELFENRKTEWVASWFRREGLTITAEGIETILELVENNTDALRRECSHLSILLKKGTPVTGELVETYLSHTREESAFTLFSRLAEGDLERSLETLHTLLAAKESPQAILAGLTWCFRKLYDYLTLCASGSPGDFDLKRIGLASKKAQRDYAQAARRYDLAAVRRLLALTADFDILFRSLGSSVEDLLMDLFMYQVVSRNGAARERSAWFKSYC